jgi:hypothetical protein
MTPKALRALAKRLQKRRAAPSLEGYGLAEGLFAAADLLEGKPGPVVHGDMGKNPDAWPERVSLCEYAGGCTGATAARSCPWRRE